MPAFIGRREFITLLGGAAGWPLVARAQQPAMPVIGYFSSRSSGTEGPIRGPFLTALEEFGFVAGRNVAIEYRFSEGRDERLSQIAADLVGQSVSMLVATDRPSAVAAKAATATIPIVFTSGLPPIEGRYERSELPPLTTSTTAGARLHRTSEQVADGFGVPAGAPRRADAACVQRIGDLVERCGACALYLADDRQDIGRVAI